MRVFHGSTIYLLVFHWLHLFSLVHAIIGSNCICGCCSVCGPLGDLLSVELEDFGVVQVVHSAGFKWNLRWFLFCLEHVETVSMYVCLVLLSFGFELTDLILQVLCEHSLYQHYFPLFLLHLKLLLLLNLLFSLLLSVSRIFKEVLPRP